MKTLEERFWSKVDVREENECWEWTASRNHKGYGEFWLGRGHRHIHAHQISHILSCGEIPEGMLVCHHCDNPSCVNPKHLYLGTPKDNVNDRQKRGRARFRFLYGEDHPQHGTNSKFHKLTEDDVRKIRELKVSGKYKLRELGEMFGVSQGVINNICQRRKWAWLE